MKHRSPIADGRMTVGIAFALIAAAIGGCRSQEKREPVDAVRVGAVEPEVAQGYQLLYDLVHRQRDVGKILFLKNASDETKAIVREIAETAGAMSDNIEVYALELSIRLRDDPLPVFERSVRDATQAATTRYLLGAGDDFQVKLLYTQAKACEYGATQARRLAELDIPEAHRANLLRFAQHYDDIFARILARLAVR